MDDQKMHSNVTTSNGFKPYTGDTPDWHSSPSTTEPNPEKPILYPINQFQIMEV